MNPPELGRMRVDARLSQDQLHVDIETESIEARRVVEERLDELRASLGRQGIRVERVAVTVADRQAHGGGQETMRDGGSAAYAFGDETGGRRSEDGESRPAPRGGRMTAVSRSDAMAANGSTTGVPGELDAAEMLRSLDLRI